MPDTFTALNAELETLRATVQKLEASKKRLQSVARKLDHMDSTRVAIKGTCADLNVAMTETRWAIGTLSDTIRTAEHKDT